MFGMSENSGLRRRSRPGGEVKAASGIKDGVVALRKSESFKDG